MPSLSPAASRALWPNPSSPLPDCCEVPPIFCRPINIINIIQCLQLRCVFVAGWLGRRRIRASLCGLPSGPPQRRVDVLWRSLVLWACTASQCPSRLGGSEEKGVLSVPGPASDCRVISARPPLALPILRRSGVVVFLLIPFNVDGSWRRVVREGRREDLREVTSPSSSFGYPL